MCLEEIALELGYLTAEQVLARADMLGKTDYAAICAAGPAELCACLM